MEYLLDERDAERGFQAGRWKACFLGHTHTPRAFVELEHRRFFGGETRRIGQVSPRAFQVERRFRYLIDTGSVGQPRDGDPRAAYGLYDTASGHFTLERVAYDIEAAAGKIRRAGLPAILAERLREGT